MHVCIFNMCLIYMNLLISFILMFPSLCFLQCYDCPSLISAFERYPPFGDPIFFRSTTSHLAGMIQWKIPPGAMNRVHWVGMGPSMSQVEEILNVLRISYLFYV